MKIIRLTIILSVIFTLSGCTDIPEKPTPHIQDGIVDLRNWDFEKDGPFELSGFWEFYWQEFIVTDGRYKKDALKPDGYIQVPSDWHDVKLENKKNIKRKGYGTYKLLVILPDDTRDLLMTMRFVYCASRIYFAKGEGDPVMVKQLGLAGKDKATEVPKFYNTMLPVPETKSLTIIFEVSNFTLCRCGVSHAPVIGKKIHLLEKKAKETLIDYVTYGCILIIALYHFILFTLYPKEKAPLWLCLVCLIAVLSSCFQKGYIPFESVPQNLFIYHLKFLMFTITMVAVTYTAFISAVFYPFFKQKIQWIISAFGILLGSIYLIFPLNISSSIPSVTWRLYLLITIFYVFIFLLKMTKVKEKRISAVICLSGYIFLSTTLINDLTQAYNLVRTSFYSHVGFLAFIFFQAFTVARENALSRRNAELYSTLLDKKEKQMRLLIGNLKSVVYRFLNKKDYPFAFLSDGCSDLTGFKSSTIPGFEYFLETIIHPDDRRAVRRVIKSKKGYGAYYRIITENGEEKWIWDQGEPIFNSSGKCVAFEGLMTDVTLAKKTENALSEFISIASHELRTPLNIISTNVSGLLGGYSGELQEDIKADVEEIKYSLDQIMHLTDNLLDLTKIEAHEIETELNSIPIENLISTVSKLTLPLIEKNGHNLEVIINEPFSFIVDHKRFLQVFLNLISNAVKYTPYGGSIIIIAEKKQDMVMIKLIDNGYGIPQWAQEKIFDKFFQADYIMSEKVGGTGLGLTIARKIIEKHGGRLYCTSPILPDNPFFKKLILNDERKGCIFTIELPI